MLDVSGALTGVPASPRFATDVPMSGRFAFDSSYLWVVARGRVEMLSALSPFEVDKEFALGSLRADQVIPTRAEIFVVGAEPGAPRALYRLANDGHFVRVKTFDYGWITPVAP